MTGARFANPVSPRDITGRTARELLRQKQDREKAAGNIDEIVSAARHAGWQAGFASGFDAGWAGLAEVLTDAGLDVDAVVALDDDDHQDDDAGGDT